MRYTGSTWKKSRHLGFSILETEKEFSKRRYGPGQHGNDRKKKASEYGKQLLEKQKLRTMYGVNERQFRRLFMLALKSKEVTGFAFMKLLESRLDNLVYRMGFARTRRAARQLVNHGHVLVNGKKVRGLPADKKCQIKQQLQSTFIGILCREKIVLFLHKLIPEIKIGLASP